MNTNGVLLGKRHQLATPKNQKNKFDNREGSGSAPEAYEAANSADLMKGAGLRISLFKALFLGVLLPDSAQYLFH
jgi:hypothetical protein